MPVFTLVDDSGNVDWQIGPNAVQAASLVYIYNCAPGVALAADANGNKIITMPSQCWAYGTAVLKAVTANLQAGDAWSNVRMQTEQLFYV
jgi:hypothetical protein